MLKWLPGTALVLTENVSVIDIRGSKQGSRAFREVNDNVEMASGNSWNGCG